MEIKPNRERCFSEFKINLKIENCVFLATYFPKIIKIKKFTTRKGEKFIMYRFRLYIFI